MTYTCAWPHFLRVSSTSVHKTKNNFMQYIALQNGQIAMHNGQNAM